MFPYPLDSVIEKHYELNRASLAPLEKARKFAILLHDRLKSKEWFGPNCRVDIFGSMTTDLWTVSSDVDICVRLENDDVDIPRTDLPKYFEQIRKCLNSLNCERANPIMCKVPIVRFSINKEGDGLHGDISFLNSMAIYNSDLLNAYSKWDVRFVKLGLFLKKWVSVCQVGSAQDGYPSSFSWTMMLIQFLQRTSPPVLPNLQQDFLHEYEESEKLKTVKGHNIYFHKQAKPNWSINKKTVGELFIGFLDYYAKFNFYRESIQIHQKPIWRRNKNSPQIVVMDPITRELRGCHNKAKFLYLTDVVIPNSRNALASSKHENEITRERTLEDLDKVMQDLKIASIEEPKVVEIKFANYWDNWKPKILDNVQVGTNPGATESENTSEEVDMMTQFERLRQKRIEYEKQLKTERLIKKSQKIIDSLIVKPK